MVSPDHNFGWQLKPDIIAINNQDQIIILERRAFQKIMNPAYLASMTSFVPSCSIENLTIIDQCR